MNRLQEIAGQDLANEYDRVWFPPKETERGVEFNCETERPGRLVRTLVIVNDEGEIVARRRES
jgi:hypothetical protein